MPMRAGGMANAAYSRASWRSRCAAQTRGNGPNFPAPTCFTFTFSRAPRLPGAKVARPVSAPRNREVSDIAPQTRACPHEPTDHSGRMVPVKPDSGEPAPVFGIGILLAAQHLGRCRSMRGRSAGLFAQSEFPRADSQQPAFDINGVGGDISPRRLNCLFLRCSLCNSLLKMYFSC